MQILETAILNQMILLFFIAFVYEIIDSSIGQGYGTLGTPTLLALSLPAAFIVPTILLSQAVGGFIGGWQHIKYGNMDIKAERDSFSSKTLIVLGIVGVCLGVTILSILPTIYMKAYVAIICLAIGIMVTLGIRFTYTKRRMVLVSVLASVNKGFSGGGYGPLATGGQISLGNGSRNAVGVTTIAEAPICLTGFILWCLIAKTIPPWTMLVPMCIGAALAPLIGARITFVAGQKERKFRIFIGIVLLILGLYTTYKLF